MHQSRRSHERALKAELARNLGFVFFDSREISSMLETLDTFERGPGQKALALCVYLSNVSARIVPRILKHLRTASFTLRGEALQRWITKAFDLLDSRGLEPAVRFLSSTDDESLASFLEPGALFLEKAAPALQTYLRGISGADLRVAPSDGECYTDTEEIHLPSSLRVFSETEKNFFLFKLAGSCLWGQIASGTFLAGLSVVPGRHPFGVGGVSAIEALFEPFADRALALDIYRVLEGLRVEGFLKMELPGLVRQSNEAKARLLEGVHSSGGESEKTAFVRSLLRQYLSGDVRDPSLYHYSALKEPDTSMLHSLYRDAESLGGQYVPLGPLLLPCSIVPEKITASLLKKRVLLKKRLQGFIAKIVNVEDLGAELKSRRTSVAPEPPSPGEGRKFILLKGAVLELDDELAEMVEAEGGIPGAVLAAGTGAPGESRMDLRSLIEEEEDEVMEAASGGVPYDEWDYRRAGYRKAWCSLFEYDVHPGNEAFVESTLKRYGGYVTTLRKKFELLRTQPRILKRQKEGEGIDIDASVEAIADFRAGLPPGDNLFTKIDRQERNLAALFLLDMSGSTKGWINQSEKEALVLMCEALESLGDRYAVYGFSGLTRSRCEFYRVKGFEEPYSEEVKRRIAGIGPKDYTRMGPAIRHAASILRSVDAATKLLITLSDGKPEDYDAYKGRYGIEDTRMALIEASRQAIHSFCITIDRQASEYLPHLYGEVNYTFIDDVRKLPARISDIYARLTT